jgi:preprotein translocase subunit SecY
MVSTLGQRLFRIIVFIVGWRLLAFFPIPGIDLCTLDYIGGQIASSSGAFGNPFLTYGGHYFGITYTSLIVSVLSRGSLGLLRALGLRVVARLEKDEGQYGRQKIVKYRRYLTFTWSLIVNKSAWLVFFSQFLYTSNPTFELKYILSTIVGSLLTMWLIECVSNEELGEGVAIFSLINLLHGKKILILTLVDLYLKTKLFLGAFLVLILFIVYIFFSIQVKAICHKIFVNSISGRVGGRSTFVKFDYQRTDFIPLRIIQERVIQSILGGLTGFITIVYVNIHILIQACFEETAVTPIVVVFYNMVIALILGVCIGIYIFIESFIRCKEISSPTLSWDLMKLGFYIPNIGPGDKTTNYLDKTASQIAFLGIIIFTIGSCVFLLTGKIIYDNFLRIGFALALYQWLINTNVRLLTIFEPIARLFIVELSEKLVSTYNN